MACYKRIYYVDYLENGERRANAGFVKLIQWKERGETSFQLYISNALGAEALNCQVKIVCGLRERVLGLLDVNGGKGMTQVEDLEKVLQDPEWEGCLDAVVLRVVVNNGGSYECVIKEGRNDYEENMTIEAAEVERNEEMQGAEDAADVEQPVMPQSTPQSTPQPEKPRLEGKTKESTSTFVPGIRHMKSDKWQQLWAVLPHIKPFDDEREYLRVELQDMVVLSGLFYRLVENSFLLHGYYNYGYLILTKIRKKDKEKIYIGVPGNYYVKEAQVAVMFGFESFEPKAEPPREGDFGYYMIGVDI